MVDVRGWRRNVVDAYVPRVHEREGGAIVPQKGNIPIAVADEQVNVTVAVVVGIGSALARRRRNYVSRDDFGEIKGTVVDIQLVAIRRAANAPRVAVSLISVH